MSFQFNFFANTEKTTDKSGIIDECDDSKSKVIKCEEFLVPEELFSKNKSDFEYESVEGFPELVKRKYADAVSTLQGKDDLSQITETLDVVTRKYEGGLKTWECSIDLLHYIRKNPEINSCVGRVLEIGCGSGLPGIYCAKELIQAHEGEEGLQFAFQDFNCSVLESVTVPNVILNIPQFTTNHREKFQFFHGDWNDFSRHLKEKSFDLILTSETIYRVESYPILMQLFRHALSSSNRDARVLLAAKDYYFGLGGSVQEFIKYVKNSDDGWRVRILETFSEGVPRSILELQRECK